MSDVSTKPREWRLLMAPGLLAGLLLALALCWVTIWRPYASSPDIRSDGVGYHIWVHGFAHGDLTFCNYREVLKPVGAISSENMQLQRCRVKYPPGVGLLQLPFSLPWLAKDPSATGFSVGEHHVVLWGGAAMLLAIACLLHAVLLRRNVTPLLSVVSIAAVMFGSGLFHYGTYDASFSHIYSAFGVAVLLWLGLDRRELTVAALCAFALVAGWLYLVRQTNGALTLAVAYLVFRGATGRTRWWIGTSWLTGTIIAMATQIAYNRYASGSATFSSYGNEGFPGFARHFLEVLVSYERGLFTYYPVFLVAAIFAMRAWRTPVAQTFLTVGAVFAVLYGSWHSWYLGQGFGHRGFVELAPLGMVVLADGLSSVSIPSRRIWIAIIMMCCMVTTLAMVAYWRGTLPGAGATAGHYWRSVLPISQLIHQRTKYSEAEVRGISLGYQRARQREDGSWDVDVLVLNCNDEADINPALYPHPPLRLSWRFVEDPDAADSGGWDTRLDLPSLAPHGGSELEVIVVPPADPRARRWLQFSVVQEGKFWAHNIGVEPLSVRWDDLEPGVEPTAKRK